MKIRRVAQLRTPKAFREYLEGLNVTLPFDNEVAKGFEAPLAQPYYREKDVIGNRFAILPMEGWDGNEDGSPSELVRRRWQRFGLSGAKLIWGGEAVAVRHDGRANPNQLVIQPETTKKLSELRQLLVQSHEEHFERSDDLLIGLQLTHSGRFCRPTKEGLAPQTLYRHPILDTKFGITDDSTLMSDDDIEELITDFVQAAVLAKEAGFAFVDVKHCHGYLGHEFLSAVERPGKYGGSFENRTRFLRKVVAGIRNAVPELEIGVRLSVFDFIPFQPGGGEERRGVPASATRIDYKYAFGGDGTGIGIDLTEPLAFLDLLSELGMELVCITAGSPYYTPHIQRPALFPPSDGYQPPEDPLVGVARQINTAADLKNQRPNLIYVGTGYSYLQEWFPNVAQAVVRTGVTDFVGIGRMALSYPNICADVLAGNPIQRKLLCRTFSDCTTAPRNGMISGCFPLDDFYKQRPEFDQLQEIKKSLS
ncbi:NADH:flavin oxidoreductase [Chloroflexi bacterium TSY]|nr:NADH:flavin oxidoreductase [Chloroflexi bacterium TSY]